MAFILPAVFGKRTGNAGKGAERSDSHRRFELKILKGAACSYIILRISLALTFGTVLVETVCAMKRLHDYISFICVQYILFLDSYV